MNLNLTGKVVLVTGGSRGIGREIVLTAAREGACVAFSYLTAKAEAESLATEVEAAGGSVLAVAADLRRPEDIRRLLDEVSARFGRLDALVHNAGGAHFGKVEEIGEDGWRDGMESMFEGPVLLTRAALPQLTANAGRVVFLSGDSALTGEPRLGVIAAARGALISFGRTLAKEVGRYGVTVNVVSLGLIQTHRTPEFAPNVLERVLKAYPLGRLGAPRDAAGMVVYLLSDWAGWITGQTISVNGGSFIA